VELIALSSSRVAGIGSLAGGKVTRILKLRRAGLTSAEIADATGAAKIIEICDSPALDRSGLGLGGEWQDSIYLSLA
jgi:hypothetical protein